MNELLELIKSDSDESLRMADGILQGLLENGAGKSALVQTLTNIYTVEKLEKNARSRLLKLAGSIEHPGALELLKTALEDESFEVRKASALSLKILTGQDFFEQIYRSALGRNLKPTFWCQTDFLNGETNREIEKENRTVLKGISSMFKALSERWTYPDEIRPSYFSPARKTNLRMAGDGRTFYRNLNFSLERLLTAGKALKYVLNETLRLMETEEGEREELEDIFRCMRGAMGMYLKILDESISGVLPAFHYLRSEYGLLSLPQRNKSPEFVESIERLERPGADLYPEEIRMMELLQLGFNRFSGEGPDQQPDWASTAYNLTLLSKRSAEFSKICEKFARIREINSAGYHLLCRMNMISFEMGTYCLFLLSEWQIEE